MSVAIAARSIIDKHAQLRASNLQFPCANALYLDRFATAGFTQLRLRPPYRTSETMPSIKANRRLATERKSLTQDEDGNIAAALMILGQQIKRTGNMIFKAELGLNAIEWTIIARVGKEAEFTQAQLATAGSHDKGQISRAIRQLQRRKMLQRDGAAGRAVPLRLTAAGSRVYENIVSISAKQRIELERGISARNLKCFCKVLDIISVNVEGMLQRGAFPSGGGLQDISIP